MNFKVIRYIVLITLVTSCAASKKTLVSSEDIKAYIKDVGLDSIRKSDLLKERYIQFTKTGVEITQAEAYFYTGSAFDNVKIQPFWNNKLEILKLFYVTTARTPFRLRISGIQYITQKGKKGIAEEFSLIVY